MTYSPYASLLAVFGIPGVCGSKNSPQRRGSHGKVSPLYHPSLFIPGENAYLPEDSKVIYESKDAQKEKVFDALEWLAAMSSHVPDKGEQIVQYYGYYSNVSRGERKKQNHDEWIPCILEPEGSSKKYRKNWARLIQKIGACPGPDPGK